MQNTHPWFHAVANPDKPAIVMADTGEQFSYRQMTDLSNRLTVLLRRLGLSAGDTLAILMENRPEYLALCWAAKNAGFYYVGVSTHLTPAETSYIVENSGSRLLIGTAWTLPIIEKVRIELGGRCQYRLFDAETLEIAGLEAALEGIPAAVPDMPRRGASMLYSSGTTGRPKGVKVPLTEDPPDVPPVRHAMLVSAFRFDRSTVFLNPGPLYHAGPLRFAMAVHREGGTVVLMRKFDSLLVLQTIERMRVTHGLFVPTMFIRMLRIDAAERRRFSQPDLRVVVHAAAPCPIGIKEQMLDWWGPVIHELYGGTEGSGTTVINARDWLLHKGSVGKPLPGCEVHIVDDAGEELPANVQGRVFLKAPRQFEYHNEPEKTAAVRHPRGWTTMGDIGFVDSEGFLYLTDRQSDMIISGGVNIYPQEAENILQSHPKVADVAVFGIPDEEFGEGVLAVVQLEAGIESSPQLALELIEFCRSHLSSIKCPRRVDFVDNLPRQENGKLYKRLLKDQYWRGHNTRII
jgi:acyl-CoA synthetase (AMP-forming)/AMP-acid ligase II